MRHIISATLILWPILACLAATDPFTVDRQVINVGTYPGDTTGDPPYSWSRKDNANSKTLFDRTDALKLQLTNATISGAVSLANIQTNSAAWINTLTADTNSAAWRQQMLVNTPIQPQWYGAKGDGATDDTAAIQAAVNVAAARSLTLTFPQGTYKISGTITVTNGFQMQGQGAAIHMVGDHPILQINDFNGGAIDGITFSTDQSGLASPNYAVLAMSENMNRVRFLNNHILGNLKVIIANTNQFLATCTNLWVMGNTFDVDLTGVSGGNMGNVLDLRGFDGFHLEANNFLCQGEAEMVKLTNCGRDGFIHGNLFRNLVECAYPYGPMINTFSDARHYLIANNVFDKKGFGDCIVAKPESCDAGICWHSEPSELMIVNNVFIYTNRFTVGSAVAAMGAWGLTNTTDGIPQQTLPRNTITIAHNEVQLDANEDTQPLFIVKGFTDAIVADNIVACTNTLTYRYLVDTSNSKDVHITGNIFDRGICVVSDKQFNYTGTQYQNAPETLIFANNTVRGCDALGCLWLTGLTNTALQTLEVVGNSLTSTNAALIRLDDVWITDAVIADNAGSSPVSGYLKTGLTTVTNEVYDHNSWQVNMAVPAITQAGTNLVVDFKNGAYQIAALSGTVQIQATNYTAGAEVEVRLQSYDGPTTISFHPTQISLAGKQVSQILQNSSSTLRLRARTVPSLTPGDIIAELITSGDPENIVGTAATYTGSLGAVGDLNTGSNLGVSGHGIFGSFISVPNDTDLYGSNAAASGLIPMISVDSSDQIYIAAGGQPTRIGGALKMGNTPGLTTNVNVLIAGGATNQLQFLNGVLVGNAP